MSTKIYFDNDVIVDLALKREPFLEDASKMMCLLELKDYSGYTSSLVFANTFYLQKKVLGREETVRFLNKLSLMLETLSVDKYIISKALMSSFTDFEDAIQYEVALFNDMDYIITRDTKDYRKSTIPFYTPADFLKMCQK